MLTKFHEGIQNFQGCVELYKRNESYMYFRSHAKKQLEQFIPLEDRRGFCGYEINHKHLKFVDSTKGW